MPSMGGCSKLRDESAAALGVGIGSESKEWHWELVALSVARWTRLHGVVWGDTSQNHQDPIFPYRYMGEVDDPGINPVRHQQYPAA